MSKWAGTGFELSIYKLRGMTEYDRRRQREKAITNAGIYEKRHSTDRQFTCRQPQP